MRRIWGDLISGITPQVRRIWGKSDLLRSQHTPKPYPRSSSTDILVTPAILLSPKDLPRLTR